MLVITVFNTNVACALNAGVENTQRIVTSIYKKYEVPDEFDSSRKVWMDYRAITDKTSMQWELQQQAITDKNGLRRFNDKYMVAVGTHYAEQCGEELIVVLEDDSYIEAIVGDIKQDVHTDPTNRYTAISEIRINVVEFIVDTDHLNKQALLMGDVSHVGIEGCVKEILKKVGECVFIIEGGGR